MEYLAPPYDFVLDLIYELESGGTVRSAVKKHTNITSGNFCLLLKQWLRKQELGGAVIKDPTIKSPYQKAIWDLMEMSLQGVSVLSPLYQLESELRFACEEQLEQHLATLPYKLMIPLLFFQFPALLILMMGPLLAQLITEVSS